MKITFIDASIGGAKSIANGGLPMDGPITWGDFPDSDWVVFTDRRLREVESANWNDKKKIALLLEPREIAESSYNFIDRNSEMFDMILTHDIRLLKREDNYKRYIFSGCWILEEDREIYKKRKISSIIASHKKTLHGHRLRHDLIKNADVGDVYGKGYQYINSKLEGLKDYMFSFTIENIKRDYWFTEKLIDCFVTGTVPVYYGCPSIGDFFNTKGMIIIDNINDVKNLKLSKELYTSMMPYIKDNFERSREYIFAETSILKQLNVL